MSDETLTLMAVFAHPDDEVWMGATMAKYSDEGVRTILVTATLGEEGEIRDPDLDPEEARERLGEIREAELQRSIAVFGITGGHILGYRDSGMAGTPANIHPGNFHNADPIEARDRLVRLIRQERPQVLMCDNERGTYEHPDHIAANRVTVAAFLAAGDATASMDGLPPWQPKKLYYTAISRSDFTHMAETLREHGIAWGEEEDANEFLQYTVPDEIITTRIDVTRYRPRVRLAMKEYRTQIAADDPWLSLPEDYSLLQGTDSFRRIRSLVDAPVPETDLFSGLR